MMKSIFDEKNNTTLNFEKSSKDDEWKFEYTIKKMKKFENWPHKDKELCLKIIRLKIYGKSEDKLTSTGVSETSTKDPLWKLLLTGNEP